MNMAAILAASVLAGFGVATATVGGSAAAAELGSVTRHYSLPCYVQLHEANPQVPYGSTDPQGYLAWAQANPQANVRWVTQVKQCRSQHEAAHGKWNFDSMILVATTGN